MEIRLEAEDAVVRVDLDAGCRISSLVIGGLELLVSRRENPMAWGCYPMAPWAGRVRRGRFRFRDRTHALPITLPPHAIHGTTYTRPWMQETEVHPDRPLEAAARLRWERLSL